MSKPVRLVVNGASGRMGRALLQLLAHDDRFLLIGAMTSTAEPASGQPVACSLARLSSDWSTLDSFDAVIDFSSAAGLMQALNACRARGAALVSGTTGLDPSQRARLDSVSRHIAVLHAGNFSLGIALLSRLVAQAAAALPDWDLEIIEAHHALKQDAPSGTALELGEAAAAARGTSLEDAGVGARSGQTGARSSGSIGFAVVRGGDIVGEHTALLAGQGELIELVHRATDRAIFARGAIEAARWLAGKPPGHYALDQMLAERGVH